MTQAYKLYGADFSLYSGKARSYLRKKGVPYEEITVTVSDYKNFIIPRTGVRFIPVVQTPEDDVFQDTTIIIDELEKRFPNHSVYPSTPKQKLAALLLELYGDEWLVIPAMHYRWNKNEQWALLEFGKLSKPDGSIEEQLQLGEKVAAPFQGSLPFLGITDATEGAIENSYEALLADLDVHFARYDYLLGTRPCVGDFGLIGPLYAHLFREETRSPANLWKSLLPMSLIG